MHQDMDAPPARPLEQRVQGAAAPREEKKGVFPIYPVRCLRCRDWDKQRNGQPPYRVPIYKALYMRPYV